MRQKIINIVYAPLFSWAALMAAAAAFTLIFSRNFVYPAGMSHDSVLYLNGAESLLARRGYPSSHFPPLFPAALALTAAAGGMDVISAATRLLIWLYGMNLFLAGTLMWRLKGSLLAGLGMLAVFALLPGIARIHFEAMSEPLFFTCLLLCFILLAEYIKTNHLKWAVLAGIAAGLAALTRYAAIFLIAAAALGVFLFGRRPFKYRMAGGLGAGTAGLLPAAIWWIVNLLTKGSMANRLLRYHPKSPEFFQFGWKSFVELIGAQFITQWTLRLPGTVFFLCFYTVIALMCYFSVKNLIGEKPATTGREFALLCLLCLGLYALTLWFSVTFVDDSTSLTPRILSPGFVILIVGMWALLWPDRTTPNIHPDRVLLPAVVLLLMFINLPGYLTVTREFRSDGILFTGRAWSTSATMAWLQQAPDATPVYSNENIPLGFFTSHPVYPLPEKRNVSTGLPSPSYEPYLAKMMEEVSNGKALLVIFTRNQYSDLYPPKETLTAGLENCHTFADSEVYTGAGFFQELCGE